MHNSCEGTYHVLFGRVLTCIKEVGMYRLRLPKIVGYLELFDGRPRHAAIRAFLSTRLTLPEGNASDDLGADKGASIDRDAVIAESNSGITTHDPHGSTSRSTRRNGVRPDVRTGDDSPIRTPASATSKPEPKIADQSTRQCRRTARLGDCELV